MASKWLLALLGGAFIGLGSALLLLTHGRIAGISGIAGGLVQRATSDRAWRLAFLAGLAVAGVAAGSVMPETTSPAPNSTPASAAWPSAAIRPRAVAVTIASRRSSR